MRDAMARWATGLMVVVALCQTPGFGQARGYVVNAEGWNRMAPAERVAYAQGLNDVVNFPYSDDDLTTAVIKVARTRCLAENKIAPNILSDIITNGYTRRAEWAKESPLFIYVVRLAEICRPIINEERARMGLPAQ